MSSTLSILNWTPTAITVTLNQTPLDPIPTSAVPDHYYPYNLDVPRVAGSPPPGSWGAINSLTVKSTDAPQTKVYDSLADPEGAAQNIALMLWVFPDCLIFSQVGEQLGPPVTPKR